MVVISLGETKYSLYVYSLEFEFGLDASVPFVPRPNAETEAETAPNEGDARPEKPPAGVDMPEANPYPNPFPYPGPNPFPNVLPNPGTPPPTPPTPPGPGRCNASSAARSSKFVVPSAFVDPDRAEQTMATLCWSRYRLD